MAQTKTIQLLRSQAVSANLEAAKQVLLGVNGTGAKTAKDGEIVLVRYYANNNQTTIKSILGIYHKDQPLEHGSINGWTILEDVASSVEGLEHLQNEVNAIETGAGLNEDGTYKQTEDAKALEIIGVSGAAATSLMSAIEKIAHAVGDADSSLTTDTSKVVTGYTQVNAKITQADTTDVVNLTLTGYTEGADSSGKIAATDTLGSALGKLQGQINGMDLTAVTAEGEVITSVSQTDGKVSASKTPIKDVKLTGYVKGSETGDIAATDDVEGALSKLENRIAKNTVSSNDKTIAINTTGATTDLSVHIDDQTLVKDATNGTISSALKVIKVIPTGTAGTDEVVDGTLGANIKEAYRLVYNGSNTAIGKQINVYKDSALSRVYLGHVNDTINPSTGANATTGDGDTALCFVYHKEDGLYELVAVNVQSFLQESEFSDGLQVANHVVSVKIDADSEKDSKDTPVDFLSVSSNGIKVSGIKDEIDRKIAALDITDTAVAGQYVSAVNETDGKVAMTRANVSESVLNNYSKGSSAGPVAATDTVNAAISKLENQVDVAKAAATAAHSAVEHATGNTHVTVSASQSDSDGKVTYTVNETNIANANDLTHEIAAREAVDGQSGDTYTANSGVNYISNATSLNNADVQLDTALKVVDDAMLTQINGSNAIDVTTKANKQQTVSLKLDTTTTTGNITSDMLEINSNGLMMKNTWDCGTF